MENRRLKAFRAKLKSLGLECKEVAAFTYINKRTGKVVEVDAHQRCYKKKIQGKHGHRITTKENPDGLIDESQFQGDDLERVKAINEKIKRHDQVWKDVDAFEAKIKAEIAEDIKNGTLKTEFEKRLVKVFGGEDDIATAIHAISNKRLSTDAEYEKLFDEGLNFKEKSLVEDLIGGRSDVPFYYGGPFADTKRAKEGVEFWRKFSNQEDGIPYLLVGSDKEGSRSYYDIAQRSVRMATDADVASYIHEIGHHIEITKHGSLQSSVEFRSNRTKGESIKALNKISAGYYKDSEKGYEDDFIMPYMGKVYQNQFAVDVATEIVSMGVELLYTDTMSFIRNDPRYATYILATYWARHGKD